ncbi:MAG: hypothetical protein KAU90_00835, partial [Sulfurovaceae bacterium]|nr:hypothetical protein [Sulfurovaceae bacterium]
MIRIILLILIFINISYADARKYYYIQLGSFRQLDVLEHTINRLPQSLRSHIVVIESNGWYIPFAYHTTKKYALMKKVPSYKRYFPDAKINSSSYILNHQVIRNYTKNAQKRYTNISYTPPAIIIPEYQEESIPISQDDNIIPYTSSNIVYETPPPIIIPESPIIIPQQKKEVTKKRKKYKYFTKRMLTGNHYYLTYKSSPKNKSKLLVKITFYNHDVIYEPIIGNMDMKVAKYIVNNKKLYMFADTFSKDGAFSKIEKNMKDYILVSSWYNGK